MVVDPFAKGGLHDIEAILKANGVDAFFRSAAERTGDSHVVIDGRKVLMAGSNDYLGLSTHPRVIEAAVAATRRLGTSVTGSRPLNGTLDLHRELEQRMAVFLGQQAVAVTTTGFQANLALSALLGREDVAFADVRNHASLVEATRLGLGRVRRYRHLDLDHLRGLLESTPAGTGRLIITDGVFSMDGDVADLPGLRALADTYGAKLVVDSAHDLGVLGRRGAGLAEHQGVADRLDLMTGTFSKAFASIGGILAGPAENVSYLRYNARPITFSAALPPASTAAALAALDVVEAEPERRSRALDLAETLHNGLRERGFDTRPSTTPIIPVRFAELATAGAFWTALFEAGVFTNLVGPPAVSSAAGMLRLSLTANHDDTHVATVLDAFDRAAHRLAVPRKTALPAVALARPPATSNAGSGIAKGRERRVGDHRVGDHRVGERRVGERRDGERRDGERRDGERRVGERRDGERRDGERRYGDRRDRGHRVGERRGKERGDGDRRDHERRHGGPPGRRTAGKGRLRRKANIDVRQARRSCHGRRGLMTDSSSAEALDTGVPHGARIWNYWLGGKDNFAADRAVGDQVKQVYPDVVEVARASREFLGRVGRFLAGEAGIRQYLDVGTGLPTAGNTHQVVQAVAPDSRVVYVDNDPLVLVHARALLTSSAEGATDYVDADVHDPDAILRAAAGTLDLGRPVALMMLGILGNVADDDVPGPAEIVERFVAAVPSGSYLVLNDSVVTPETAEAVSTARSGGADYHLRTPEEIEGFLDGLDVVYPGVVSTPLWRPEPGATPQQLNVYCGVGRKP